MWDILFQIVLYSILSECVLKHLLKKKSMCQWLQRQILELILSSPSADM